MVKRGGAYSVWIETEFHAARETLPGNIRQRVKRLVSGLTKEPRPANSQSLDTKDLDLPDAVEMRRIRLERWRILYAVNDLDGWVWIFILPQKHKPTNNFRQKRRKLYFLHWQDRSASFTPNRIYFFLPLA
jgi:mRNA-degrading endonuclease RelE of RelBE toxin-antitoxin system